MTFLRTLFCLLILFINFFQPSILHGQESFKKEQLRYSRVRTAYAEKESLFNEILEDHQLSKDGLRVYLRAFKKEGEIQLWARDKNAGNYRLLKTYQVCEKSGSLGPKRARGDYQVPEGYYRIDRFNPASSYYLSLGLNYPNKSDRVLGKTNSLGGDIFIHGNCVTIGCLPITDNLIKELYVFMVESKANGQKTIPITVFPMKLTELNYQKLVSSYKNESDKLNLWEDLKKGFDYFNKQKQLPSIGFLSNGRHRVLPAF